MRAWQRREFLKLLGIGTAGVLAAPFPSLPLWAGTLGDAPSGLRLPAPLKKGDLIALAAPAGAVFNRDYIRITTQALQEMGFRVKLGKMIDKMHGYLAGKDLERAEELNLLFADPEVKGIVAMRGGWGCARILPLLDYELIAKNPKMLVGLSDITSLLIALYTKSSMVTFHGPTGYSSWNNFSTDHFLRVVRDNEMLEMRNAPSTQASAYTLVGGKAEGVLVGGNLSVLSAMLGSPFLPDWEDKILFLEDLNEDTYRLDRMLTHLKIAGVFDKIKGFVFGNCRKCVPDPAGGFSLQQLLHQHFDDMPIPSFYGSQIGHIADKFTVPIGVRAQIDADAKTIRLLQHPMAT